MSRKDTIQVEMAQGKNHCKELIYFISYLYEKYNTETNVDTKCMGYHAFLTNLLGPYPYLGADITAPSLFLFCSWPPILLPSQP